ncbi:hypothetical protein ACH427_27495 [Streptomyces sp. NPDC020379]|uniref:hypothetical protein n=1 Tax=Streptomyces sp. NPDC020379 TaxID=3365071 RepID=UPI0037B7FD1C
MSELLRREQGELFIESNVFTVLDPDVMDDVPADFDETGILTTVTGGAAVLCGTHIGTVSVTAESWSTAPPLEAESWQDVAEMTLIWPGHRMEVWGAGYTPDEELPISIPGPGSYRIRVCGRHRDDGEDRHTPGTPQEEYLLQIWPSPAAEAILHKATSSIGARWRTPHTGT